jgi:hypothetical protein
LENELIQNDNLLPKIGNLEQYGHKNVNIVNGGTVNLNFNDSSFRDHETEKLMAVQAFSKEYYQLLVTDVISNGLAILPTNKSLIRDMVPNEIFYSCSSLSNEGKLKLKTFPAIICKKNTDYYGKTSPSQKAWFCYITGISVGSQLIQVAFQPLGAFKKTKFGDRQIASYFGINVDCMLTDLNLTGWYVHKINIFNAFDNAGIEGLPHPD